MPSASDVYITPASKKIEWYDSSAVKGNIFYDTMFRVTGAAAIQLRAAADSVYVTAAEHLYLDNGTRNTYSTIFRDDTGEYARFKNAQLGIGTAAPDTSIHTTGDITVEGSDIFFGTTDKIKLTRGGTTYFQMLTSGGSAAGLQALGVMVNHAYGSTPQRATITIGETGSKPTAAADYGYIWVKNDSPNKLYFTDDDGTDHDLTAGGGGGTFGGTIASGKLAIGTATDTIGNFVDALTENDSIWLGSNPTATTNSASNNVALGKIALDAITIGDNNTAIGYNTLSALTEGDGNIGVGKEAGKSITTGVENTIVGECAGEGLLAGGYNVAIGSDALKTSTAASYTIAIGKNAMSSGDVTASRFNIGIGYATLQNATSAGESVMVGAYAGDAVTTGGDNTGVGHAALSTIAGGISNTAMGREAMRDMGASSNYNVGIGQGSFGYGGGTQLGNTGIGTWTGYYITGNYNLFGGYKAGYGESTTKSAFNNVGLGREALSAASSGYENVAVGYFAMKDNTTGYANTAIGAYAGTGNTIGLYNTAMGFGALQENTHGDYNTALGHYALYNNNPADGTGENTAIGSTAGYTNTTGIRNVFIGRKAGYTSNASNQVMIGREAGSGVTTGGSNVLVGPRAGYNVTIGAENVMIGHNAGYSYAGTTSGVYGAFSTFVGHAAGYGVTGNHSYGSVLAIGHQPLYNATSANRTIAIGNSAGVSGTSALDNVYVGYGAGSYADSTGSTYIGHKAGFRPNGNYNVAVGFQALSGSSAGSTAAQNVAIGHNAASNVTTANKTVAIGERALHGITTAVKTIGIGYYAGYAQTTDADGAIYIGHAAGYSDVGTTRNIFIGNDCGQNNTTGENNLAIGYKALEDNITGIHNVSIGRSSSLQLKGNQNVAVGTYALGAAVTQYYNTAIGDGAMRGSTGGDRNTAIGYHAIGNDTTGTGGSKNTALGFGALRLNSASNTTAIGYHALNANTSGEGNTAVGWEALDVNTTGIYNTALGMSALGANTTGNYNTVVGYNALHSSVHGDGTVAVGYGALYNHVPADNTSKNVAIGFEAGYDSTTASYNTFIGYKAGHSTTTAEESVYIGYLAGEDNNAQYNVFIGNGAGEQATGVGETVAIGRQAMGAGAATGDAGVMVGYRAGYSLTAGADNTFIGVSAGLGTTTANSNAVVGKDALKGSQDSSTGGQNAVIGVEAGKVATGMRNVMLGFRAGYTATSADQNVYVGYEAGQKFTTGDKNVALGPKAGPSSTSTDSNKLYINNDEGTPLIGGDFSTYQVHMNANVGIGNTNPQAKLHLSAGSANEPVFLLENTHAGDSPPFVKYFKNSSSPASGDEIGQIQFDGNSSTGVQRTYGDMYVSSIDVSNGSEDGEMVFRVMSGGTLTGVMSLGYDGNGFGMNLFKSNVSGSGLQQINYPNINNAYFAFGSDLSYSSGSATYKPAGFSTDGNPDPNDSGGDQQLAIFAQDDVSISAGNYGKNGGNDIVLRTTNTAASNPTTRMRIKGDGKIGIGTDSPSYKLDVRDSSYNVALISGAGNGNYPILHVKDSTDISTALFEGNRAGDQSSRISIWHNPASAHEGSHTAIKFQMNNDQNAKHTYGQVLSGINDYTENTEDGYLAFSQIKDGSLTEGMRINSTGVGIGTTSPEGVLHTAHNSGVNIFQRSNDSASYGTNFYIRKSRGTVGSESNTQSGDLIGQIGFSPYYGDYDNYAASISAKVTGTLAADTTPGYLAFSTAAAGANTVSQRMCIDAAGNVGIATTAPAQKLHVEGGFRFRDGNSSSQRLEGYGQNDNFMLVVSGSDALGLAGGTPGVRFNDSAANTHLTVKPRADGVGGTTSALLSGANSAGLYFATQSGTRLELTGNHIIKTGQTIDNMLSYATAAVHTATTATQTYQVESVADPGQAGVTRTTTLNLPNGNVGGERFTVTCIAVGSFKPGTGNLTGEVVLGGNFINGTNFTSPNVTSFTGATAAGANVMQVKTYEFTWVAAQFNTSTLGGWVYTYNTM